MKSLALEAAKEVFGNGKLWEKNGKTRIYVDYQYLYNGVHPKLFSWGYVEIAEGSAICVSQMFNTQKGGMYDEIRAKIEELQSKLNLLNQ